MTAVGVIAGQDPAEVRVLAESVAAHHPDWSITVVVPPGLGVRSRFRHERVDALQVVDLLERDLQQLIQAAPSWAIAALARPLLVERLFDRGAETVLLLPPDAEVTAPLDPMIDALAEHAVVTVPRLTGRLPNDGRRPDGHDLLEVGEIDDELVSLRSGARARAIVTWWTEEARQSAEAAAALAATPRPISARFEASLLGAAARVFDEIGRLEDPGIGVSYWNLHERPLSDVDGAVQVAGRLLRLMRWRGFRPDRPWWLSEHANRVLVLDDPLLGAAARRRAEALRAAGWVRPEDASSTRRLPTGVRLDARLRRLHDSALDLDDNFGDVLTRAGAEAFTNWLTEPAPRGAAAGVNRYGYDVWLERRDVQEAYPDLDQDGDGFIGWLWVHGREELGLQTALLPPPPEWVQIPQPRVPPVLVAGYLRGNLGLGAAARSYIAALRAAEVPVTTRSIAVDPPVDRVHRSQRRPEEREFTPLALPAGLEPEINLLCVNADELPRLVEELGPETLKSAYTIGHWAWETDYIPERWRRAFDVVDEVWVFSTYVAEHIARAADVPVVVVPLPVVAPDSTDARLPFELPDRFVFLFAFDFFSTLQRKNPLGLIDAFKRAFEPDEGPVLVLKTSNADFRPEARDHLKYVMQDRPDIRLVDGALSPAEMAALFARADCYVSLHRSEGYGLTIAESMALGKPVIATAFSGNTDFMTPANSYPVDWRPAMVGPDAEHYPPEGHWAEPNLDHAAALMRDVVAKPEESRARGARAAADIAASLSTAAVGDIARRRLMRVAARRDRLPEPVAAAPHPELGSRLAFDRRGGTGRGLRGVARRAVFRALRPYSASQAKLDEAIVETLRRADLELQAERTSAQRLRGRVSALEARASELERLHKEHTERNAQLARRAEAIDLLVTEQRADAEASRARLDELSHGARAIPFTAGEPFATFEHPLVGRVLGLRAPGVIGRGDYPAFEEVFRGPRDRVAALVAPYVELLRDHAPVLDVGCGRGELLEQLAGAGIPASGVDADVGMAAIGRTRGLDVTTGDALTHLRAIDDESLGAIVSIQVVEHLAYEALLELFELARRKLRSGGLLVAETVNPHAVHALKTFWVDMTHRHPIFPEVMLVVAATAGFEEAFVWHPGGAGDFERDRFTASSYALVATA